MGLPSEPCRGGSLEKETGWSVTPNVGVEAGCQENGEAGGTTYRRSVPVLSPKEVRLFTQPQVHTTSLQLDL